MIWKIESNFDYNRNMWMHDLMYSNDDINYRHYATRLDPDKQPTDEILEYFEKKKKEYTDFLESLK